MSCNKCNSNKIPCGCDDTYLKIKPPCDNTSTDCLQDDCPETFSADCTIWTGNDIVCGNTTLATAGDSVAEIITAIVSFFCSTRSDISLLEPDPIIDSIISTTSDILVSIDRNNCFDDNVVFTFDENAPTGILFSWDEGAGVQESDEMTRSGGRSAFLFDFNVSGIESGNYSFNTLVTSCGVTIEIATQITV